MKEIFEHTSYRTYLKSVLAERITKNTSYSLRAMAKALGIQSSHLSSVQNGVKNLSLKAAVAVAGKLGLDATEAEYFCLLVQYENEKSPELKATHLQRLRGLLKTTNSGLEFRDLGVDAFKLIADWYHIPTLEMLGLDDFEYSAENVARRLGVSVIEARAAIERLERLELIERDAKGRYRKAIKNPVFQSPTPNKALRHFHRQMLEKAIESLETQSPAEKYNASHTLALDPRDVDRVRRLFDDFRKNLAAVLDQDEHEDGTAKKRTAVYHLNVQFFNLTHKGENK